MRHETLKQKRIPELHFKPEGYVSDSGIEFLDQFLDKLREANLNPDDLVFSGFDESSIAADQPIPPHPTIFGMNEAAWREAIKLNDPNNPAIYAHGDTPCIGLYNRFQLAQAYSYEIDEDRHIYARMELKEVAIGDYLADLGPEVPIEEALVHKDYPEGSPTDALVGLVYLDK